MPDRHLEGRRPPDRVDGYAALRSYAPIGDGRSLALVSLDGAVDWLAWPDLDSPALFAAILDSGVGGACHLAPAQPFHTTRQYLPGTNVLETVFHTVTGSARVLDVLSLRGTALGPARELQRRVEGVEGSVTMTWHVRPGFSFGSRRARLAWRSGVPVAMAGADAVAVCSFDAGRPRVEAGAVSGCFETRPGSFSVLALCAAHGEPLVLPTRAEVDARYRHTVDSWRAWSSRCTYGGPWQAAVERSALALKLLVYAPTGAVAAAGTMSLPEQVGGQRNWDYRFSWVRDSALVLDALLAIGCAPEAEAYFWWLMHATQLTQPRLQPMYRLDGGSRLRERTLALAGYRRSAPVRAGNEAAAQQQLDSYGELLHCAWLYSSAGGRLDAEIGRRLARTADFLCLRWSEPDAGIWEVRSQAQHFTHSKMMCWIGMDRAVRMADSGRLPRRHRARWQEQAAACAEFIEQRCFSSALDSYVRSAGSEELDASVLLGLLAGYGASDSTRWRGTIAAVDSGLRHGPFVYRYTGEDGLPGQEGAFISCTFWLVEALARTGRTADARALMQDAVELTNDVGILAEEADPLTGDFLGNLPQGLSHLSLIGAATALGSAGDP